MRAKLFINDLETTLDFEELENACLGLNDNSRHKAVFNELAKSESQNIRRLVADKRNLSPEAVKQLAIDISIEVLREIISNEHAKQYLDGSNLQYMLDTDDTEICLEIADNLEDFTHLMSIETLCKHLVKKGPAVRLSLAENGTTPIFILTELSHDRDVAIAEKATKALRMVLN